MKRKVLTDTMSFKLGVFPGDGDLLSTARPVCHEGDEEAGGPSYVILLCFTLECLLKSDWV